MSRVVVFVCLTLAAAQAAPIPSPEPKAPLGIDRYLLPDTNHLAFLNVKAVVKSPLFEKHLAKEAKALLALPLIAPHVKALGIDPLTEIDRVFSVAGRRDGDENNPSGGYVIVQGRFAEAALRARLDRLAKDEPDVLKAHGMGAARHYEIVAAKMLVAVVDRGTVVLTPTRSILTDVQAAARGAKRPALKHKELADFVAKMKPEPAFQAVAFSSTVVGLVPDPATGKVKMSTLGDLGLAAVRVELAVKDDARFKVELTGQTDEGIKKVADGYEQGLVIVKPLAADAAKTNAERQAFVRVLDSLKSRHVGKQFSVEGVADADAIRQTVKELSVRGK